MPREPSCLRHRLPLVVSVDYTQLIEKLLIRTRLGNPSLLRVTGTRKKRLPQCLAPDRDTRN